MLANTIYKIFISKFNTALKTNTEFFYSPANVFVEQFLHLLCQNKLIQQYIILTEEETFRKTALIYLYSQKKIELITNLQRRGHTSNMQKTYRLTQNKKNRYVTKYNNIRYLISTPTGLKLEKNKLSNGIYIAAVYLQV